MTGKTKFNNIQQPNANGHEPIGVRKKCTICVFGLTSSTFIDMIGGW